MTQKTDFEKMESKQRWFMNIGITVLIIIVGTWIRTSVGMNINKDDIEIIRDDYMPYDAFIYSLESNQKLINLITSIQSGDDKRYQEALKEWNDLQQNIINKGKKTRGTEKDYLKELNK